MECLAHLALVARQLPRLVAAFGHLAGVPLVWTREGLGWEDGEDAGGVFGKEQHVRGLVRAQHEMEQLERVALLRALRQKQAQPQHRL